jgi:hypothetical protein
VRKISLRLNHKIVAIAIVRVERNRLKLEVGKFLATVQPA